MGLAGAGIVSRPARPVGSGCQLRSLGGSTTRTRAAGCVRAGLGKTGATEPERRLPRTAPRAVGLWYMLAQSRRSPKRAFRLLMPDGLHPDGPAGPGGRVYPGCAAPVPTDGAPPVLIWGLIRARCIRCGHRCEPASVTRGFLKARPRTWSWPCTSWRRTPSAMAAERDGWGMEPGRSLVLPG